MNLPRQAYRYCTMKIINFSPFLVVGYILFGSGMNSRKLEEGGSLTKTEIAAMDETIQQTTDQYLIPDSLVGLFSFGNSWQQIAKEVYQFEYIQGYGNCMDACCEGNFILGQKSSKVNMAWRPLPWS